MKTFEQHRAALRKAADAGDMGSVREIEAIMDTYPEAEAFNDTPASPEMNMQNLGRGLKEDAVGIKDKAVGAWDGLGNFIEQGGNILEENYLGVKDGVLRADQAFAEFKGQSHIDKSDSLDRVNADLEANRRRQALVPDGVGKVLGGIAGEVVTAAPLLATGAGVGAGILRGASLGAAEGAGFEFATNAGSLVDRVKTGAIGAVGGAAGGALVPSLGKGVGYLRRRSDAKKIYANDNLGNTEAGDRAMREAEEIGVPLDRVDAEGRGFDARKLAQDANQNIAGASEYTKALNESSQQTTEAGRRGIAPGGDIRATDDIQGTRQLVNESAENVQKGFDANREASERLVTDAYEGIRVIDSKSKIPIPGVVNDLKDLAYNSVTGIDEHVLKIFKRNGLIDPTDARGIGSDGLSRLKVGNDITVDQAVKVRKQLTRLFNPNNPSANQELEEIKNLFDDAILNAARNNSRGLAVTPEQIAAREGLQQAAEAVSAARKNFVEYRRGTTAEKATRLNADGNASKTPAQRMDDLWSKEGNVDALRTQKASLEGQPKALEALEQSANGKVMSLIDQFTNPKSGRFNSTGFSKAIKGWSDEFREEMLGKKGKEFLDKFERTTALQGRKNDDTFKVGSDTKRNQNQVDHWIKKAVDLFSASTLARNPLGRGVANVADITVAKGKSIVAGARVTEDIARLRNGQLPKAEVEGIQAELVEKLRAKYPDIGQGVGAAIIRRYLASVSADVFSDNGEGQASPVAR